MAKIIKLPFLGSFDLSKPSEKKVFFRFVLAFSMLLLMAVVLIVSSFTGKKKSKEPVAQAVTVSAANPGIGIPDIPQGTDNDRLEGTTTRDVRRTGGSSEGTAEQLFLQSLDTSSDMPDPSNTPKPADRSVGESVFSPRTDVYPESSPKEPESEARDDSPKKRSASDYDPEKARREALIRAGIDPDTGQLTQEKMDEFTGKAKSSQQASSSPASSQSTSSSSSSQGQPASQQPVQDEEPAPVLVRRSGGVSSLGSRRGGNVGSLDEASQYVTSDPLHPFMVKFAYDQKVSSGDRVTLRLCEDMTVGDVLIPVNTHLFATCNVGERMELTISNININGQIYPLNYIAYDTDGGRGLYCPTSTAARSREQATSDAETIASSAISAVISGYAGRIVQSGSNIIRSIGGSTSVKISAGYMFFIMRADAESQMRR